MTWPAWVLVICAAVSFACVLYGALRAALAARTVKMHVDRVQAFPLLADAAEARVSIQRINHDLARLDGLLARANVAVRTLNEALAQMRIPEAVAAARAAGAAIRLLFSGR